MTKLPMLAVAGIAAAAIAGTALAASSKTHVMNVALPDGAVAHIQYVGDVAPKVTVEPRRLAGIEDAWRPMALPSFAGFGRMMEEMGRRNAELMRQVQQMPGTPGMNVASFGSLPAGGTSTSVVSYSNGASTCTRTTQVVSQGAGKPPKVTTNVSGDCSSATPPPPTARSSAPIDRT
jgi:hypothetical protein